MRRNQSGVGDQRVGETPCSTGFRRRSQTKTQGGLMMLKNQPHPARTLGYLPVSSKETVSGDLHESKVCQSVMLPADTLRLKC